MAALLTASRPVPVLGSIVELSFGRRCLTDTSHQHRRKQQHASPWPGLERQPEQSLKGCVVQPECSVAQQVMTLKRKNVMAKTCCMYARFNSELTLAAYVHETTALNSHTVHH